MTIIVNDGTYRGTGNTDITLSDKDLRIISENGSASTLIETLGYGPAFIIDSGQTSDTLIRGFTIETAGDLSPEEGVVVDGTSPVLEDLVIHNCGLEAISCLNEAAPQILNCEIYDVPLGLNAIGTSGLLLQECLIYDVDGRGIYIEDDDAAEITWSTISNCLGGITLSGSDAEIRQCIIRNNNAPNYYEWSGVSVAEASVLDLANSDLVDTTSADENGAGILLQDESSPLIQNCLIVENRTWADDPGYSETVASPSFGLGGGIYIPNGCNPIGVNCTVVANTAQTRGGGIASAGRPVFRNMIIWDNTSYNADILGGTSRAISSVTAYQNLHLIDQVINIWYSNIEGGYANAVESISVDPLLDTDYTLLPASPCIDSGTYYLALKVDLAGNLRPTTWPDTVDMGCYEYGALPSPDPIALSAEVIQATLVPDPTADTDGDGFSDSDEIALKTDRYDTDDYFTITHDQSLEDNTALIAWESAEGCFYTVQFTESLTGQWTNIEGWIGIEGDGSTMICKDTRDAATRFYRVLVSIP
jgi:hypothetical protein